MNNSRPHLLGMLAGLFLAAGLVCSSIMATTAWVKIKNSQFVTVKGSARKNVTSDLAIWTGNFTTEAETLLDAQHCLHEDRAKVEQFLKAAGMTNYAFTSITIQEMRARFEYAVNTNGQRSMSQEKTVGYKLKQSVVARSGQVDRIEHLDSDSTALVEQGVMFTTDKPKFIYTRAGEAKIEMLAEATKDARIRAEQISRQGGRSLARLHRADMGVFQITPLNSAETSWEGMNDTSYVEKTITAVVTATFALN